MSHEQDLAQRRRIGIGQKNGPFPAQEAQILACVIEF